MVSIMNEKIGEKIINSINILKYKGVNVVNSKKEGYDIYSLKASNYKVEISLHPQRWLGLEFYLLDQNGKTLLTYDIDTDLYPISGEKYYSSAKVIEKEIVNFLESLNRDTIKIGEIKGKPAMIIPKDDGFLVIKKGWFFTSSKHYKDLKKIKLNGSFRSL